MSCCEPEMAVSDTCTFPDAAFAAAENVSAPGLLTSNDRLGGDTVTPGGSPLCSHRDCRRKSVLRNRRDLYILSTTLSERERGRVER